MAFIDNEDVKPQMGISLQDDKFDALLTVFVPAVLSIWDEKTDREWASAAHTEYYDAERGQREIQLKNYPVTAVTSVYDDSDWGWDSGDLIAAADYNYGDGKAGILRFDTELGEGRGSIKITYTAGYTDANVPAWLKELLIRQTCHWYLQQKENRYDLASKAAPQGAGTYSYKLLTANLLPDFIDAVERNRIKP